METNSSRKQRRSKRRRESEHVGKSHSRCLLQKLYRYKLLRSDKPKKKKKKKRDMYTVKANVLETRRERQKERVGEVKKMRKSN